LTHPCCKEGDYMGSAGTNGPLWSAAPKTWATLQEPFHKPLFSAMLEAAGVGEGTRVLDVGCGTGCASAMALARGAEVYGIDCAQGLIDYAQKAVEGATFGLGDIENLEFEDRFFDVVFAANSVQYAESLIPALKELSRVCKQGGRIVAGLFGPPDKVAYTAVFAAAREVMPPPPPGAKPGGPFALSGPGVLAGKFAEAGLEVVGEGEVNCPFRYENVEEHWKACASAGAVQALINAAGEDKLRTAIAAACQKLIGEDGSVSFDPNVFIYVVATP
jgi:SAM-dependent methyltransferase